MSGHTHDFWRMLNGGLMCNCGHWLAGTPSLSPAEQMTVDRFGIFDEESGDLA